VIDLHAHPLSVMTF